MSFLFDRKMPLRAAFAAGEMVRVRVASRLTDLRSTFLVNGQLSLAALLRLPV